MEHISRTIKFHDMLPVICTSDFSEPHFITPRLFVNNRAWKMGIALRVWKDKYYKKGKLT